jgi:hypothetical protein
MIDRLPITYIAHAMPGHRRTIDIPRANRRASLKQGVPTTSEYLQMKGLSK